MSQLPVSGFTKVMVDILLEEAKKQGYVPDASVAGDEVVHGARPNPFMVYKNLDIMNVTPIQSVVKVRQIFPGVLSLLLSRVWEFSV